MTMRPLLWKESREILPLGLLFALMLMMVSVSSSLLGSGSRVYGFGNRDLILFTVVWCLAALAFPAFLFGAERERRTMEYVHGLPLRLATIWLGKSVTALSALVLLILFSLCFARGVLGARWFILVPWAVVGVSAAIAAAFLACSMLSAAVLSGTSTAMAGGMALGGFACGGGLSMLGLTGLSLDMEPMAAAVSYLSAAALLGSLALAVFSAGEHFPRGFKSGLLSLPAILVLVSAVALAASVALWMGHSASKGQVGSITEIECVLGGPIYFTPESRQGKPLGIWYVTTDGLSYGRVTGKRFKHPRVAGNSAYRFYSALETKGKAAPGSPSLPAMTDASGRTWKLLTGFEKPLPKGCEVGEIKESYRDIALVLHCSLANASDRVWILTGSRDEPLEILPQDGFQGKITYLAWCKGRLVCTLREQGQSRCLVLSKSERKSWRGTLRSKTMIQELSWHGAQSEILAVGPDGEALVFRRTDKGQGALIRCPLWEGPGAAKSVLVYEGPVNEAMGLPGRDGFLAAASTPNKCRFFYVAYQEDAVLGPVETPAIVKAALSPDDRFAAFLTAGRSLGAFDFETGTVRLLEENVSFFPGPSAFVHPRKLAFVGAAGDIRLANVQTGKTSNIF